MLQSFWLWFGLFAFTWTAAILQLSDGSFMRAMIGCTVFFVFFFLAPLVRHRSKSLTSFLIICLFAVTAAFWPETENTFPSLYVLLLLSMVFCKAVVRLPVSYAAVTGFCAAGCALMPALFGLTGWPIGFILLYFVALGCALAHYKGIVNEKDCLEAQKDELLSEYRQLKRYRAAGEEMIRQQERTKIARDMHDSVGHKLTALLMQLEVFRLQAAGEASLQAERLKRLAKESLEETRQAVKALNQQETEGFQAILHLIRQWEAESFVRVQFSVGQGVLSVSFTNEQSVTIYRTVQEALTNAMRHGSSKEVHIAFEAPAGRVFRFEIANAHAGKRSFQEGFGLSSMRERIEQLDGELDFVFDTHQFVIKGAFPLGEKPLGVREVSHYGTHSNR